MPDHHILDIWLESKEPALRFINELWLIDGTLESIPDKRTSPEREEDNIHSMFRLILIRKSSCAVWMILSDATGTPAKKMKWRIPLMCSVF